MRFCSTALLCIVIQTITAYVPLVKSPSLAKKVSLKQKTALFSSDDDDWFADRESYGFSGYNDSPPDRGGEDRRGGGFVYERDTSRDNSNIDEGLILGMLEKRGIAKRNRDFETADAIREDLLVNYHVGVYDRERTWRTGVSVSGSGKKFGGGGRNGRRERKHRDFGPNQHDYVLSADAGPSISQLSEKDINSLLAERLQAKLNRNYDVADKIQLDLIENSVFVHDGTKEWRADGVPYGDFDGGRGPGRTRGSRNDQNRSYTKSPHSAEVVGVNEKLVDALVNERLKFKISRDYDKADSIREGLRTKFNVMIDDRLKEWSIGGDFGEEHNAMREMADKFANRGFIKSNSSRPLSKEDEEYIQSLVDERAVAKKERDFHTADDIRDELMKNFDVNINDKLKLWSVGGVFSEIPGSANRKPRGLYERRGGGDLTDEDVENIQSLLSERYDAKKNRKYDVADRIRDALKENFNVKIDDKSSEWHVDTDEYVLVGESNLSTEDIEAVESQLRDRFAAKREGQYEEADEIRDALKEKFGVRIDDRTKEWSIEYI